MTDLWSERARRTATATGTRGARPRPDRRAVGGGRGDSARRRDRRRARRAAAAGGGLQGRDRRAVSGDGARVVCRAEDLPFADGSFDAVVTRVAPITSTTSAARGEMARVARRLRRRRGRPLRGEAVEEAERSAIRHTSAPTRGRVAWALRRGARASRRSASRPSSFEPWLARTAARATSGAGARARWGTASPTAARRSSDRAEGAEA